MPKARSTWPRIGASAVFIQRGQAVILAARLSDGSIVAMPVVEQLIAELQHRQVRLLIVDPLVKSHCLEKIAASASRRWA